MRSYVILKDKRQVIGIDHYGGKSIRATAKCIETDTFDEAIGKEIVDAKLNYRIAVKRTDKMYKKLDECAEKIDVLQREYNKLNDHVINAILKERQARNQLDNIENKYM